MKQAKTTTKAQHREQLRKIVKDELAGLPALLADLSPKERVSLICKLLPFVMDEEKPTMQCNWDDF